MSFKGLSDNSASSFASVFHEKITTLQQLVMLHGGNEDDDALLKLEKAISELEEGLTEVRQNIVGDRAFIAEGESMLDKLQLQAEDIALMHAHVPAHLTKQQIKAAPPTKTTVLSEKQNTMAPESRPRAKSSTKKGPRVPPPLRRATPSEFEQIDKRTRGRITFEKFNDAIDDLDAMFATKYKLLASKNNVLKDGTDLRNKRALKEAEIESLVKAKAFYLSTTDGKILGLKQDATTKTLLSILRGLKCLKHHSNHGLTALVIPK